MGKKFILLAVVLMSAWIAMAEDNPKIYVSTDLVGIAMGSYQLALEVPVANRQSLMLQGQYFDWQLGYMPEFYRWYLGLFSGLLSSTYSDDPYYSGSEYEDTSGDMFQMYIDLFDAMDIKSYGGQLGFLKYTSNSGFLRPYSAAYLGYTYSKFSMQAIDNDYLSIPPLNLDIHSAILAGRFGAKAVVGFLAADLYIELALAGMYADFAGLIEGLGMDALFEEAGMDALLALYMSPISIMPSMNFGLRFSIAL